MTTRIIKKAAQRSFFLRQRLFVSLAILFALLLVSCERNDHGIADYPNRSIELIVPWAAGGGTDRVARFIADALQRRLGQPVIVVNRTGGSGAVGHSAGALAAPDGHTLTMATFELSTMRAMGISKLTWEEFTPVAQVNGDAAAILVRADASWKTLGELLAEVRRQPGKFKMSGTSTGGAWDLARSGLLLAAGIAPTNVIWSPAQGSAPALVELLGGHIDVVCCSVPEAAAQIEGRQVRVLAVLGPERLADFPEFPTAREQGVDYEAVGWRGIMLPKGTPPEIAKLLSAKLAEIAASDEFRQFMKKNGFAVIVRGPDEFAGFLRDQEAKWRGVIEGAGYQTLGQNHDPGPRAMPILLATLFVIVFATEAVFSRRRRRLVESTAVSGFTNGVVVEQSRTPWMSADAAFLLAALVIYIAVMPWIGFTAATGVFTLAVMWRLGTKWWLAALGSIVIVTAIHLLFVVLFKVQLP